MLFEEKLKEFLHYLKFEKRYSEHTLVAYNADLVQFLNYQQQHFQFSDLKDISHFHIRSWLSDIKENNQKAKTINRKMSSLNSYFKFLMKLGLAEKNPVKLLHAQRLPERLPNFLKEPETEQLLEQLTFEEGFKGKTDKLICELLYTTGMRRNELLQLKETDIEWGLQQLRVLGKGNKERLIPISLSLLDNLRDYLKEKKQQPIYNDNFLLNLTSGEPLYAGYIYRVVKQYLTLVTSLNKKSPHILRHTFATHLLNNGANIQAIKDLLGHSSLAATQVYTHNNIDKLKEIHKQNHPRG